MALAAVKTPAPAQALGAMTGKRYIESLRDGREVWIDGKKNQVKDDDAIVVPAGARHNVVNTGAQALKLYTVYGPPEHKDGTLHRTKKDAAVEEHFDGKTTEKR